MSDLAGGSTGSAAPPRDGAPVFEDTSRKLSIAFAAAVALHAALLIPIFSANTLAIISAAPMVVDLQAEDIDTGAAAEPSAVAMTPAAPAPAAAPASAAPAAPAAQARTTSSNASDFVIPTPKTAVDPGAAPAAAAPSFRTQGGTTGAAAPLQNPDVQPKTPTAMTAGSAPASAPTKGTGTTVQGAQPSTGAPLDLKSLDQQLAAKGSGTAGSATGTGKAPSSGAPGPSASAGAASGSPKYQLSGLSANRKPKFDLPVKIPPSVAAQGLSLKVTVTFTVAPDGTVSAPKVKQLSGNADWDAAVIEAVRKWLFDEDSSSPPVTGTLTCAINVK